MRLDSSVLLPSPSDWFFTTIECEGWGRIEFAEPKGSVEGPIDEHYKVSARADRREHWADVVCQYRTDVIHYGYLDLDAGGHDWRDVWAIVNHLYAIMARVILQALGYDGGYHPTVCPVP